MCGIDLDLVEPSLPSSCWIASLDCSLISAQGWAVYPDASDSSKSTVEVVYIERVRIYLIQARD
ncbi:hypothetical protein Pst134EB_010682 [Puccinia striiformis f. sp. tritici]|nr:hypothetical protein Pst134EB_010682 [Puccinia striiformis f. sp. tritici]